MKEILIKAVSLLLLVLCAGVQLLGLFATVKEFNEWIDD